MSAALRVELELADGSFTSRLIHAGESVDAFTRNVGQGITAISRLEKETDGLLSTMRDVTVTLAVAGHAIHNLEAVTTSWAGEVIHVNAEFERMKALLVSMSTAVDPIKEATDTVNELRVQAANAPFSLNAMHDAFIRLKSAGLDPMVGSMHALTDAVAAFGGNDQTLHRASLALQEMAGKGVVQMKELRNQLGMAIPTALPMLARQMGVSYEELMHDIHTGTVDAKATIQGLDLAFERAFGGAAARQMQTFNGQVSRLQVNLQNLALHQIGDYDNKNGYFQVVRQQFMDLNTLLEGSTAQGFAEIIGHGLTSVVTYGRQAIDTIARFKDEIGAAGEVLLAMLFSKAAWGVVQFGISQIKQLGVEFTLLATAARTAQANMDWNNFRMQYQAVVGAGQGGMSVFAGTMANAWQGMRLFSTGISLVLPWLTILGPALAAAAEYFGLFHNKTEEAYDSLVRFGAKTAEQANAGDAMLKSLDDRIKLLKAYKVAQDELNKRGPSDEERALGIPVEYFSPGHQKELDELIKKRDEIAKKVPVLHDQGIGAEAKAANAEQIAATEEGIRAIQARYSALSAEAGAAYDRTYKELAKAHKDPTNARTDYAQAERNRALAQYDEMIAKIQEQIAVAKELAQVEGDIDAAKVKRARGAGLLDDANKRLEDLYRQRRQQQDLPLGVPMDSKALDPEKLYAKGQEALARIKDQIVGFEAGLDGLDPKVAALMHELNRGTKFGDVETERVRELIEEMGRAKTQADILNEALKGQQKFQNDLRSLGESLDERIFKAKNGNLSETDQLVLKVQNGFYKGLGSDKARVDEVRRQLADTRTDAINVDKAASDLARTLIEKTFGNDVLSALGRFDAAVKGVGATMLGLKFPDLKAPELGGATTGAEIAANGTGRVAQPMFALMEKLIAEGADPRKAAGFAAGTSMESGTKLDPAADNGSHLGIAQWDRPRWAALNGQLGSAAMMTQLGQMDGIIHELRTNEKRAGNLLKGSGSISDGVRASDAYERPGDAEAARRAPEAMSRANALYQAWLAKGGLQKVESTPGLEGVSADQRQQIIETGLKEHQANALEMYAKIGEATRKFGEDSLRAGLQIDEARPHFAKLMADIKTGAYVKDGVGSTDPNNAVFKEAIAEANKADAAEKLTNDRKKARSESDTAIKDIRRETVELQAKHDELWASIRGGDSASSELLRAKAAGASKLASIKGAHGEDSDEYRAAQKELDAQEDQIRSTSIAKHATALDQKTAKLREAIMNQEDAQNSAYDREVARYQKELDEFRGTAEEKKRVEESLNNYIAAYRAKQEGSSPMARQMREWGDLTRNAQQMTANWMSSTSDAIAELATKGTTNWKKLTQSMTADLVKMSLHFGMSQMFSGLKGAGGAATGGKASLFGAASGGGGKLGVGHNATGTNNFGGGLTWVGEKGPELVSLPQGAGIAPANSVPAMSQQGAGSVPATLQQTNVRGGDTHSYTVSVSPTIQATGGTTAQNADLSKQVSKHVEDSVRRVMSDEVRRQMRPGGTLDGSRFTTQR